MAGESVRFEFANVGPSGSAAGVTPTKPSASLFSGKAEVDFLVEAQLKAFREIAGKVARLNPAQDALKQAEAEQRRQKESAPKGFDPAAEAFQREQRRLREEEVQRHQEIFRYGPEGKPAPIQQTRAEQIQEQIKRDKEREQYTTQYNLARYGTEKTPAQLEQAANQRLASGLQRVQTAANIATAAGVSGAGGLGSIVSGAASGAAVGGPWGAVAGGGIAALTESLNYASRLVKHSIDDAVKYNPQAAVAQAMADLRQTMRAINQSDSLGPRVARLIEMQAEVDEKWDEIMLPIKEFLLEVVGGALTLISNNMGLVKIGIDLLIEVAIQIGEKMLPAGFGPAMRTALDMAVKNLRDINANTKGAQVSDDPFLEAFLHGTELPGVSSSSPNTAPPGSGGAHHLLPNSLAN